MQMQADIHTRGTWTKQGDVCVETHTLEHRHSHAGTCTSTYMHTNKQTQTYTLGSCYWTTGWTGNVILRLSKEGTEQTLLLEGACMVCKVHFDGIRSREGQVQTPAIPTSRPGYAPCISMV